MPDLIDISIAIIGIIIGIITAIFTVYYTHKEEERLKFNESIESLISEIEYNRNKLPKFPIRLNDVKKTWIETKKIEWINDNEISVGYRGYLHNFFKFDSYNNFMSLGLNAHLEHDLDYSLKMFYHNCKQFCADTQTIEEEIRRTNSLGEISVRWARIELEYQNIQTKFDEFTMFNQENQIRLQITWANWHIRKIRKTTL